MMTGVVVQLRGGLIMSDKVAEYRVDGSRMQDRRTGRRDAGSLIAG